MDKSLNNSEKTLLITGWALKNTNMGRITGRV
jgi:hypothetical protein